jgi:hypothetical protein
MATLKIRPQEWRRALGYAVLLTLFTLTPYLIGWARAGTDWSFNGIVFALDDGNSYLGKIRIGAEGGWKFFIFYTPEQHDGEFGPFLPHIAVGHLLRPWVDPASPNLSTALAITFQIWRVLACLALTLTIFRFCAVFLKSPRDRLLALTLATLGGGLGWLLVLTGQGNFLGSLPIDFYIPENFSFLTLYGLPHIATARALLLLGFLAIFAALRKERFQEGILAGLCWIGVGLLVTFYLAVIYVLLASWGALLWLRQGRFPRRYTGIAGLSIALSLPLFAYNAWLFTQNSVFSQWSSQNDLPTPHPVHYVIGYGLLAVFAAVGIRWAWRKAAAPAGEPYALLIAWLIAAPLLVYLPINVQRRLSEGVFIPLIILAVFGMRVLLQGRKRLRRAVVSGVLISSFVFWGLTILGVLSPSCSTKVCLFRPRAELTMMDWLEDHAESDSVVLGSYRTGNYLPIRTNLRPVLGHGPETLYYETKGEEIEQFYRGELSPYEQAELFQRYRVHYVVYGPLEREIGTSSNWQDTLSQIYDVDGYLIYEVKAE